MFIRLYPNPTAAWRKGNPGERYRDGRFATRKGEAGKTAWAVHGRAI